MAIGLDGNIGLNGQMTALFLRDEARQLTARVNPQRIVGKDAVVGGSGPTGPQAIGPTSAGRIVRPFYGNNLALIVFHESAGLILPPGNLGALRTGGDFVAPASATSR
jgi:hypothetical protein